MFILIMKGSVVREQIVSGGANVVGPGSRGPGIYTDEEVDKTVQKHHLFPKLTEQKSNFKSKDSESGSQQQFLSPTSIANSVS